MAMDSVNVRDDFQNTSAVKANCQNCSITQTVCLSRYKAIIFNGCTLFSKAQVEKISLFPKVSYGLVVFMNGEKL